MLAAVCVQLELVQSPAKTRRRRVLTSRELFIQLHRREMREIDGPNHGFGTSTPPKFHSRNHSPWLYGPRSHSLRRRPQENNPKGRPLTLVGER